MMMTTHPDTEDTSHTTARMQAEDTSHTTARMQADADAPPPPGAARMLMQDARRRQHMRLLWSIYEGGFAEQLTMLDGTPPPSEGVRRFIVMIARYHWNSGGQSGAC